MSLTWCPGAPICISFYSTHVWDGNQAAETGDDVNIMYTVGCNLTNMMMQYDAVQIAEETIRCSFIPGSPIHLVDLEVCPRSDFCMIIPFLMYLFIYSFIFFQFQCLLTLSSNEFPALFIKDINSHTFCSISLLRGSTFICAWICFLQD